MIVSVISLIFLAIVGFYLFFLERRTAQTLEEQVEDLNKKYAQLEGSIEVSTGNSNFAQ
jgi:hypothetical protein